METFSRWKYFQRNGSWSARIILPSGSLSNFVRKKSWTENMGHTSSKFCKSSWTDGCKYFCMSLYWMLQQTMVAFSVNVLKLKFNFMRLSFLSTSCSFYHPSVCQTNSSFRTHKIHKSITWQLVCKNDKL